MPGFVDSHRHMWQGALRNILPDGLLSDYTRDITGAARAVFIESDRRAAAVLRENLRSLGLQERARVIQQPANVVLQGMEADVIFLDPPYKESEEYASTLGLLGRSPPMMVIGDSTDCRDFLASLPAE